MGSLCAIKTRLRSRLTDVTLTKLMRIAIEGPEQSSVNFEEVFKNHRIQLERLFKQLTAFNFSSYFFLIVSLLLAEKLYCDLTIGETCWGRGGG